MAAAGALFRDERGRLLVVEPVYKAHWDIPGGIVEPGETPTQACVREVEEELGLAMTPGPLLAVDWAPHPDAGDRVLFVFDGGVLSRQRIAAIRLRPEELRSYRFVAPRELSGVLIPRLARRITAALSADSTRYLEHGVPWALGSTGWSELAHAYRRRNGEAR
jgi:8-oxo-dGTP diphosphatase